MPHKILIVDDEPFNLDILEQELVDRGYLIERANCGAEALAKIESTQPDLVLLDYMMPDMNGPAVLAQIRGREHDVPVIIITAHGTIERAVEAIKQGACDFITKPFEPEHVALAAQKALEQQKLRTGLDLLAQEINQRYQLITGDSPRMAQVIDAARKAAQSRATILVLGESGAGKEILVRAIHAWSDRRDRPFVAINCVGLSRELLESELFGHEKGAFTGAHQLKKGKMELADDGTVFLDEVGDISTELQTKLLRFLQEREFERVGGTRPIRVDVRVIAATNCDLEQAVKDGEFREDLYYRLNVVPIRLPPLRERREDIPVLAQHFLQRFASETKKNFTGITPEAETRISAYHWPGNVRELANAIERAVVLGSGPKLGVEDLPATIASAASDVAREALSYRAALQDYKRDLITRVLSQTQGNRAAAARVLGLQRTYLARLLKSLGIE
ncbi:MAG: sigma-54-dependent Fis family transcriptional regulator [Betaproteobacteria bacterium]|nr:sigma-54-dependent Fis family transcriptional regulator [Betaproteobacteria bacterium]